MTYISASTARSCQPTYSFHSSAIAARNAMKGTIAPMRLEIRCARVMTFILPGK